MKINYLTLINAVILLSWTVNLQAEGPMGLPANMLGNEQWSLGIEFGQGEADWSADGQCTETVIGIGSDSYQQNFQIENLRSNMVFGQLAYGLTQDCDVFVRLGAVQSEANIRVPATTFSTGNAGRTRFDSDYGFAGGAGIRTTFYRGEALSLGGLLQGTWFEPSGSRFIYGYPGSIETLVTNVNLRYFQTKLSLTGMYREEHWYLWMGPFLQYIKGDLDMEALYYFDDVATGSITCAGRLDDNVHLGAHLGAGLRINGLTYRLEGQFTNESWLWTLGVIIRVK